MGGRVPPKEEEGEEDEEDADDGEEVLGVFHMVDSAHVCAAVEAAV
jgi:hypothetical protein